MNDEYDFWAVFPLIHKIGCYPTIYYECKYNLQNEKEYEIIIHWVDRLTFNVFESTLRKEIEMGILKAQSKIDEISEGEAKEMISEFKRGARQCRRFIKEQRVGNSVFEYFLHASFDDGKRNKSYENMIKDSSFLSSATATSSILIDPDDIKRFDRLLLHVHAVRFTRVFMNVLDLLEERIEQLNIRLQTSSFLSSEEQKEYELILINKHSSKELTYLFNLLYRIRFYELRDGDNAKLFRLIAGIYKSERGSKANKANTVKNNWNNSEGHKLDRAFLNNFLEKILSQIVVRVQEDINSGYDSKRMSTLI